MTDNKFQNNNQPKKKICLGTIKHEIGSLLNCSHENINIKCTSKLYDENECEFKGFQGRGWIKVVGLMFLYIEVDFKFDTDGKDEFGKDEFVPVEEDGGSIVEVTRWIISQKNECLEEKIEKSVESIIFEFIKHIVKEIYSEKDLREFACEVLEGFIDMESEDLTQMFAKIDFNN